MLSILWLDAQDILIGNGKMMGPNTVKYDLPGRVDVGGSVTAKDIIIASGSVPFVPPGQLPFCQTAPCLTHS